MSKKCRIALWTLLVERGNFPDRKVAESWIMAGKVIVNEQRVDVGGERVPRDAEIRVKGIHTRYVGRGGLKLEGALSDFGIDVSDKVALDAGACTGGFTDCLLQHGETCTSRPGGTRLFFVLLTCPRTGAGRQVESASQTGVPGP